MTVYFMGGEIGSFTPQDGDSNEAGDTNQLGWDSNFSRTAVYCAGSLSANISAQFAAPDDFWFHALIANRTASGSYRYYYFKTASTDVLRLGFNNVGIKVDALIGAVWTEVIPAVSVDMGTNAEQTIDMHVVGNSGTGTIALYISGVLRDDAVADLSAVTGITTVRMAGSSQYGGSQFIIADEPTVGWRLMTYVPTGAGATGDMTGDYTGIDERVNNDADFLNSGTANQVELFTTTPVGSVTGYIPRAVGVYCRARCGVGGPQNLQLALRSSGTTYFSGNKALDVGYGAMGHIWNTDPATSAAFLASAIASLQPGVKSIT